MKNITWNKVKTTVKDWQVGDYIRQTSIVVIGVLITFVGSELVTQNSEKKDIQAVHNENASTCTMKLPQLAQ